MGLRDWVSEMARSPRSRSRPRRSFNGAPRLGLGDGTRMDWSVESTASLQWGSETGSRRWQLLGQDPRAAHFASMGLRDWVSEMACGVRLLWEALVWASMGLRDWVSEMVQAKPLAAVNGLLLQWGSETGSRRWLRGRPPAVARSLLQWGSETGSRRWQLDRRERGWSARFNGAPRLGLGDGEVAPARGDIDGDASMGLRDWVSEMGPAPRRGCAPPGASMGLRDWVSEMGRSR